MFALTDEIKTARKALDAQAAAWDVKLARKLEKLPVVAAAFAEGAISQRHASGPLNDSTPS